MAKKSTLKLLQKNKIFVAILFGVLMLLFIIALRAYSDRGIVVVNNELDTAITAGAISKCTDTQASNSNYINFSATCTSTPPPSENVSVKNMSITKNSISLNLEYCSNGDALATNTQVTKIVYVIHGDSRNACDHANYIIESAKLAGVSTSTLVIAPHYYADTDTIPSNTLYWSDGGWKSGSNSLDTPFSRPWRISSYEALDNFVAKANKNLFPNLNKVVVVGHSAGGQFTNRYAATTRLPNDTTSGVARKYVVSNPSSYLYFNSLRYFGSTLRALTSSEVSACPTYDNYKYGLKNLYSYQSSLTNDKILEQYSNSRVTYLLGESDTSTTDTALDASCEARLQGVQRLDRGTKYYQYIGQVLGAGVYNNQDKVTVPDVGHESRSIYTSTQGQKSLFE